MSERVSEWVFESKWWCVRVQYSVYLRVRYWIVCVVAVVSNCISSRKKSKNEKKQTLLGILRAKTGYKNYWQLAGNGVEKYKLKTKV